MQKFFGLSWTDLFSGEQENPSNPDHLKSLWLLSPVDMLLSDPEQPAKISMAAENKYILDRVWKFVLFIFVF
ncbi:MAG: hypothetical protein OEZ34_07210, partial [Spirochaetia bacterium]|nr:hypothetical protein [Spirochaetia bacterium]